ncbi:hypothetical protein [Sphingobacterium sp.]|uniref:hypothetical protein n=1 Tax=Sphingobacterium sp. TaxID=341027 RepID=UPI0031DEB2E1
MKKILNKIGQVLQVVLLAPIKLPGKAVNILKYIAVGLGVLETVLDKEGADLPTEEQNDPDQGRKTDKDHTGERSEADETQ